MPLTNSESSPAWHKEQGSALAHFDGDDIYILPDRPEGFGHLFPATSPNITPQHILDEAITATGAERLLSKLDKADLYHDYAAADIAEHYAKHGEIRSANRLLEQMGDETLRAHVLAEMVFFEQDHPKVRPLPLAYLEHSLYETAVDAYNHHDDPAAAHVLIEAADALPDTDLPLLAQIAQVEHPEIQLDLDEDSF